MSQKLHIDIETYSSIDIMKAGAYKYCESVDFEILMVAYALDDEPIKIIDLAKGEILPMEFIEALENQFIEKHAHNANFERNAFRAIGYDVPIQEWHCSAVKAGYCGYPLSLAMISEAMKLEEKGKLATGKALIRFFSCPVKPTIKNGNKVRNFPNADLEKWEEYKRYCINDVEAEREIGKRLEQYAIPDFERQNYLLDQEINDRGILIDLSLAKNAYTIDGRNSKELTNRLTELTGLSNPNSPAQLSKWLSEAMQKEIKSLAKDSIVTLFEGSEAGPVREVLGMRLKSSKTSVKKYLAMLACACEDNRAHGLFQFYGASRTGRWAGRLIQLQNLPQNHLTDLDKAREAVASGDYDLLTILYDDIADILSQLIRTSFIAKPDHTFIVADFSAIEARVIAWLAGEKWRLDVFNTHGKIYEASASMMFGVPIEEITKGNPLRAKGKIAELALGYQGAAGALAKMDKDGVLTATEREVIVKKWRAKNLKIVGLWKEVENAAKRAIKTGKKVVLLQYQNLIFFYNGECLTIELPSGRKLIYQTPELTTNKYGQESIKYKGIDQLTKKWWWVDSYGGKFVENIVQAIARDLLAQSMLQLKGEGFDIVMHVHDEVVCEIAAVSEENALKLMCLIMSREIPWAKGLPLAADGYFTKYYKKD